MKKNLLLQSAFLLLFLQFCSLSFAQGIPEILYYKFNDTGKSVRNLASSPPSGTTVATLNGSLKQGSTGTCGSTALIGSGNLSNTDYMDTKWTTSMTGSWTISFWGKGLDSSTTLFYLFSNITAGALRCFSGGVAGLGNIILRGPLTDVLISGGASKNRTVCTWVYDASAGNIYAYLNGNLVNTVAQSTITLSGTANFMISGYNSLNGLNAGGLMDEFRFYSHALSAKEVKQLIYSGQSSGTVNMKGCNPFKSPSGKYTWTKNGTYYDTIPNYVNCDSFMTINLTLSNPSYTTINPTACDYYLSPSKKIFWTKSGVYYDVLKNKAGCDSNITINLTIKYSTSETLNLNKCGSYKSPSGKYTWTTSGQYLDTIPNKKGCDSLLTINLTIGYTSTNSITVKACDKYISPSKKSIWTSSGNYKDTLVNSTGCDSILIINLTINKSSANTITEKACEKYKSPSGKNTWVISGTYADTVTNKKGCDSILTIKLTINKSTYFQINPKTCGTYKSPSGKYTYNFSTSFYDTIPNKAGCDSIIAVNLIILKTTSATISRTVCKRFVSPSKKRIFTVSGKYYDTIPNKKGCDSLITINLTVNNATVVVSQKAAQLTALADPATYQWLDCNNNYAKISGATNQIFTATALGKYAVEVTEGFCTDTSICYDVTSLKINNNNLVNYLTVFPNPANGQFTISSSQPFKNATIKILNAIGEIILQATNINGTSLILDISSHANGIYFIEITEKDNSGRIKLIKY